jgi:integrase/recombinase XerD
MPQAKVLTDAEMRRLLAGIDAGPHAARNRVAIMLSYLAGLRVGEISHLKVSDLFESNGVPRSDITLKAEYTKTKEARRIFIGSKLKRELTRYLASLSCLPPLNAPLICSQKRTAFSPNSLCQLFGRLYAQAGITGASSHSGRRSFITKLAHSCISTKVIMSLAGHRQLSTTQRYIEINDQMLRQAVEVL